MPDPFGPPPDEPAALELSNAYTVLSHARATAESFLEAFDGRLQQRGPGAPSDQDYDFMRALLLFACAGLDSMIKHLIQDALPVLIDREEEIEKKFERAVAKDMRLLESADFLASVLTSANPRGRLVDELVSDLTSSSLQSKHQVLRAASFFGLDRRDVLEDPDFMDTIFRVRNTIAHEMDVDFDQPRRSRTPRRRNDTVRQAEAVFACAGRFLRAVDGLLEVEE